MSGSASLTVEQSVLGHTLAFAPMTAPTQVFVALCRAASPPSASVLGTEVSGAGYGRTRATFGLVSTSANTAANTTSIEFPMATGGTAGGWGTIGYFELWDAAVAGRRLYWGQLLDPSTSAPTTLAVLSGDVVRFSPATLSVQAI